MVPLACIAAFVGFFAGAANILGDNSDTFAPRPSDSGLPSEEDYAEAPPETPWLFAKDMSDAVGRDTTDTTPVSGPVEN